MYNLSYSIPYFIVLTIFLVYAFMKSDTLDKTNKSRFVCCATFLFFFGFRGFIGWDWTSYYPMYENLQPLFTSNVHSNFDTIMEYGFIVYATIIKTIFADYHTFIFISAAIDLIVLDWLFRKYSLNYALSFAVFMFVSLTAEINTLRNTKSIMVFLMALPAIEKRQIFKYYILNIIAILLHNSAFIFLPLYFFLHKRMPRNILIWIFIVGNVIYLSHIPIITGILSYISGGISINAIIDMKVNSYLDSEMYSSSLGVGFGYIERFLTMLMVIIYYDKILSLKPSNILFVNLYILYMIVILYFTDMTIIFHRLGGLFIISYWIIWPALIASITNKNNLIVMKFVMTSLLFIYVYRDSRDILYKYDNILIGADSYNERVVVFNKYSSRILEKNTK